MSHLSSTVPPHIMLPALRTFDDILQSAFFEILSTTPIVCSEDRMFRAKLKLSLPTPAGCGLLKTTDQGSFAWWASVSSCLGDELLFSLRSGLEKFAVPAWEIMVNALGGHGSRLWTQVKHLLPTNAQGLTDGSFYSPLTVNKGRLCTGALELLSTDSTERFRSLASPSLISGDGCLTPSQAQR